MQLGCTHKRTLKEVDLNNQCSFQTRSVVYRLLFLRHRGPLITHESFQLSPQLTDIRIFGEKRELRERRVNFLKNRLALKKESRKLSVASWLDPKESTI